MGIPIAFTGVAVEKVPFMKIAEILGIENVH